MVNRIWYYHFGRGLVRTPSDFGFGGGHPSHPELLDWLATEFVEHGWSSKYLHRLIMLSSVYRQSSRLSKQASIDGDNEFLWRFRPHRLEAESVHDAILSVAGVLDLTPGGPGYEVFTFPTPATSKFTTQSRYWPGRVAADDLSEQAADAYRSHV